MPDQSTYRNFLLNECSLDAAHDLAHVERVVTVAKAICEEENGNSDVVTAAAWLHDCVTLPKNHPDRSQSSYLAGKKAAEFLDTIGFPNQLLPKVVHAIEAHSYSAGIKPESLEAEIVQDADRLDALGAIGIARCLMIGGKLNRPLYNPDDPFCETRKPDDSAYTMDHFYEKLFKLPDQLNTTSAKEMAARRIEVMKRFLMDLKREI